MASLNPLMQQAHLVPRKNKGKLEVCLDADYKGLISIMINSGIAKDVFAHVVYRNDIFEYDATSETVSNYVPYWNREDKIFSEPGEERATFCCVINPRPLDDILKEVPEPLIAPLSPPVNLK